MFIFLASSLAPAAGSLAAPKAQNSSPTDLAQQMLDQMTPQERVGQLFLITFDGDDVDSETAINDLIVNQYVGGVVLLRENDNFLTVEQPLNGVVSLIRQLQSARWNSSQQIHQDPLTNAAYQPPFIPLFISLPQEGDGFPYDQLLEGLTAVPNQMAIGATWNPDLAANVGNVVGKELSTLGINLLLGPSLDVLETPHVDGNSDLGTRTFGGAPYWVGEMSQSYIRGIHEGSSGRMAVVAKHFPGHGGSDRLPEEEVATVRKSLDELKDFELEPFFAVTGNAASQEETADALMTAHIRYQGFQGNIRATTRPVSLDPQAFNLLMTLPQIDSWRQSGGLMVSDNLGSQAVRRFYDLTSQTFSPQRVALNAFLAGNDILYIADFSSPTDTDTYANAIRTIDYFTQKYRDDTAFAQRVDQSVLRILTLKYKLYGSFSLSTVLPSYGNLPSLGRSEDVTFEVARQAATLISPLPAELDDTVPDPPNLNDRIVFITDAQTAKQCSTCEPFPLIDVKNLEQVVLRRYGPQAGGQVSPGNLRSYTLADLDNLLSGEQTGSQLETDLGIANWIVFSMLDFRSDIPSYDTLERFLSERPDLFQQKRLIVFAFNAPYYLDATNISKLTAYYGLYSKAPQFLDVAGYLLFRELRPGGALPVSVPGTSYNIQAALYPDPNQVIPLMLDQSQGQPVTPITSTVTPTPAPIPEMHIGDSLPLQTGTIIDHNGRPVPDGTQVEFWLSTMVNGGVERQIAGTANGIARVTFNISSPGALEVRAVSSPAQSETLRFDIPYPEGMVAPTITFTPEPTSTPTLTPSPTVTQAPAQVIEPPEPAHTGFTDWLMAFIITAGISLAVYRLAALLGQVRWGIRGAFLVLIGGLIAYSYLALQMPGSQSLLENSVSRGVFLVTLFGSGAGLLSAWIWHYAVTQPGEKR